MIRKSLAFSFISAVVAVAFGGACGGAAPAPQPPATVTIADAGGAAPQALAPAPPALPGEESAVIPITAADPAWGSKSALVTIVEFSDFQCPFCMRVEATLDQLKTTYGPEKLRVVWKNEPLPFHPNARPAAEAAVGVFALGGNDAFWRFHDAVFGNQTSLSAEWYEKWAGALGVDVPRLRSGLAVHEWDGKIAEDHALAKTIGVNGTPAFYINGVSLSGAQPFDKFQAVIDVEMQKAQALVAAGMPRERVYLTATNENHRNPPPRKDDEEDDDEKEDTKTVFNVRLGNAPIRGPKTALVTIVEFSDFQCPFCKRVEDPLKKVQEKYGSDVRLVWKNEPLPFHPRAMPAAQLALEARAQKGDAAFWTVHDKLFASQPKLEDSDLERIAKEAGLDVAKVKSAIASNKYKATIDADADLADDLQASGTPHFFINGRRLVGAQPAEKFEKIIDEELVKARALVSKGIAPTAVYDTLMKEGKGPPAPEKKTVAAAAKAPERGSKTAKVVIQMFSDFQCPFCKRVEPTVDELMKTYGNRVKIVWRNTPLPMHPAAPLAAEAAAEAFSQGGSTAFWKMHDLLFAGQGKPDGLSRDALLGYAQEAGLDVAKMTAALDTRAHKAEVDADMKAANDAGISGTPAFVINGYYVSGAQPFAKFRRVVERALAEAGAAPHTK